MLVHNHLVVVMNSIAIARVSTPSQNLDDQRRQICDFINNNNVQNVLIHSLVCSAYTDNYSVSLIEDPNIRTVYVVDVDRLSRCMSKLSESIRKRHCSGPLTVYEISSNTSYVLYNSIISRWPAEFVSKLEIAEAASLEKSRKSKAKWQNRRLRINNLDRDSPELIKHISKTIRKSKNIYRKLNLTSIGGYMKRKTTKKGFKNLSLQKIKNITKNLESTGSNNPSQPCRTLTCSSCGKNRQVFSNFAEVCQNFVCSDLNHFDCDTEELGEPQNETISEAMDGMRLDTVLPNNYYLVDKILQKRIIGSGSGIVQFKIKWFGYSETQATWENYTNIVKYPAVHDMLINFVSE